MQAIATELNVLIGTKTSPFSETIVLHHNIERHTIKYQMLKFLRISTNLKFCRIRLQHLFSNKDSTNYFKHGWNCHILYVPVPSQKPVCQWLSMVRFSHISFFCFGYKKFHAAV